MAVAAFHAGEQTLCIYEKGKPVKLRPAIDEIRIEADESGFELHLDTEGGILIYPMNMAIAEALYDQAKTVIGPWLRERDEARATMPSPEDFETRNFEFLSEPYLSTEERDAFWRDRA